MSESTPESTPAPTPGAGPPSSAAEVLLTADEARVLGVLIEKAQTTPAQYPLSVNAVIAGAGQKNNRAPVKTMSEDDCLHALDGLRVKGLAREVFLSGSRVQKHRHVAREAIELSTSELVILAELLLRGPQTVGEIRGRASRMHPLESTEVVGNVLEHLMGRTPPLVRRLPPAPGSRAARFGQLLCPTLHPLDAPPATPSPAGSGPAPANRARTAETANLEVRVARLEQEVAALRRLIEA